MSYGMDPDAFDESSVTGERPTKRMSYQQRSDRMLRAESPEEGTRGRHANLSRYCGCRVMRTRTGYRPTGPVDLTEWDRAAMRRRFGPPLPALERGAWVEGLESSASLTDVDPGTTRRVGLNFASTSVGSERCSLALPDRDQAVSVPEEHGQGLGHVTNRGWVARGDSSGRSDSKQDTESPRRGVDLEPGRGAPPVPRSASRSYTPPLRSARDHRDDERAHGRLGASYRGERRPMSGWALTILLLVAALLCCATVVVL